MKCKFLHLSDVHLGYQQYNHKERFNDFGWAFQHVVDQAIHHDVDFVVLGGDLFQKRSIDPPTLLQAIDGLVRLQEAGIPVVAVEGNHERAHYRDVFSWTDFLAERGYLHLLSPTFREGLPALTAWDGTQGAYVDLLARKDASAGRVRIYGAKYYGTSTHQVVAGLAQALAAMDHTGVEYAVLVLHAGLEGVLPHHSATLTYDQIAPLREYVDYLALGHIHKPFEVEDWIYNPGSLETCGIDEVAWPERGYYLVDVDTGASRRSGRPGKHRARLIANPRRLFLRLSFSVDAYASPEAVYAGVEKLIRQEAAGATDGSQPVVELVLEGVLAFDRFALDLKRLEGMVEAGLNPLLVRLVNRAVSTEYEVSGDESKSRVELEREVVEDLVERDARYRPAAGAWTDLILDIKRMVLEGTSPQGIIEYLQAQLDAEPQST
jgi:DNA repair exonuclease SbcCD nuclease subunit